MLELLVAVAVVLIVEKRVQVESKLKKWEKWSEKMYPGLNDDYTRERLEELRKDYGDLLASTQKTAYMDLDETKYNIK